ncbi:endonuclease [Tenacibaculum sp. KUL152]|nr:endonuclease [Tenacibaculum sp. KUL152]
MRNVTGKSSLARRIKRRGPIFVRGYFATKKNVNNLYFESFLELAALLNYENDPTVDFIDTQPASFLMEISGKIRRYTPDLLIRLVTGELIYIEVKASEKADEDDTVNKHKDIERRFLELNRGFEVFTENALAPARLKNLEILYHGASNYFNAIPDVDAALAALPEETTIEGALSFLEAANVHPSMLDYLLFNDYFQVDQDTPINEESPIYLNVA